MFIIIIIIISFVRVLSFYTCLFLLFLVLQVCSQRREGIIVFFKDGDTPIPTKTALSLLHLSREQ